MNRELNLRNESHYQIIIECLQSEWVDLDKRIEQNENRGSILNVNTLKQRRDSVIELLESLN
jgi:hypothetical protein